jgi:hypothetical protein
MKKPRHKQKKTAKPKAETNIILQSDEKFDPRSHRIDLPELQFADRGQASNSDAWKQHVGEWRD